MRAKAAGLAAVGLAVAAWCVVAADDPKGKAKAAGGHDADLAAIRAVTEAFLKAYNAGDAKGAAASFTDGAEIVDEDGEVTAGREAIEARFKAAFAERPGSKLAVEAEAPRFVADGVAVERGIVTLTNADGESDSGPYIVVYAKQGGRWLQASVRDEPAAGEEEADVPHSEHLKELAWLVGQWVNESDEAAVDTTIDWADGGNFLVRSFTVKVRGMPAMTGSQRIGWDPLTRQIKSWVFDSSGGHGEALWTRDGDRWLIKATGVTADGQVVTATQILTYVDPHRARWTSTDRTLGGEAVPDIDEFVLVHKPPAPK